MKMANERWCWEMSTSGLMEERIREAIRRYEMKFGHRPEMIYANPQDLSTLCAEVLDLKAPDTHGDGVFLRVFDILIEANREVIQNHLYLGMVAHE